MISQIVLAVSMIGQFGGLGGMPASEDCICMTTEARKADAVRRHEAAEKKFKHETAETVEIAFKLADAPTGAALNDLVAKARKSKADISDAYLESDKAKKEIEALDELLKVHDKMYGAGVRHKDGVPKSKPSSTQQKSAVRRR